VRLHQRKLQSRVSQRCGKGKANEAAADDYDVKIVLHALISLASLSECSVAAGLAISNLILKEIQ
jgi:hypothetical protein